MSKIGLGFRRKLEKAIFSFAMERPRLYKGNKEFFDQVLARYPEIVDQMLKWFQEHPKSTSFIIYTYNRLSRWTEIIIRIKRSGKIEIFKAYKVHENYGPDQIFFIAQSLR